MLKMQFGDELESIVLKFPNETMGERETEVCGKIVQEFTLVM